MTCRSGGACIARRFGLRAAAAVLLFGFAQAAGAQTFGNCELSGQKGSYHITPATPGQLTVEVSLPAPGWWNGDTPDTIKDGYEYCMAAEIAYRTGLSKLAVVNVSWAQLIGGHTTNFDLALSEASITEPRKKVVDFSVPYFNSDIALLVKKSTMVDSASAKDLRIGVHQGTTGGDFIADTLKPTKQVQVYPNVPAMLAALNAGQIDAAADDTAYMLAYASKSNGALVVAGQYSTGETYGAVYPKGSPNEATFDKIIGEMKADGTLDKLASKYLAAAWGTDPTKVPYLKP
ncbi:MAG: amino acid ABC transporter substrate-binding protein [Acidisphaera sp.]|nr:amino acid ABC transporter substrate-binding protein [Acidisphaera sp.]